MKMFRLRMTVMKTEHNPKKAESAYRTKKGNPNLYVNIYISRIGLLGDMLVKFMVEILSKLPEKKVKEKLK